MPCTIATRLARTSRLRVKLRLTLSSRMHLGAFTLARFWLKSWPNVSCWKPLGGLQLFKILAAIEAEIAQQSAPGHAHFPQIPVEIVIDIELREATGKARTSRLRVKLKLKLSSRKHLGAFTLARFWLKSWPNMSCWKPLDGLTSSRSGRN